MLRARLTTVKLRPDAKLKIEKMQHFIERGLHFYFGFISISNISTLRALPAAIWLTVGRRRQIQKARDSDPNNNEKNQKSRFLKKNKIDSKHKCKLFGIK